MDTLRISTPPPPRRDLRPALRAAAVVVLVAAVCGFAGYHLRKPSTAVAPSVELGQRVLVEDPVSHRLVDPATAPAVLEIGGKKIYFDSMDSLNKFKDDPVRYARVRVRVQVTQNGGAAADANPPVASSDAEGNLPPGEPPEPPSGGNQGSVPSASGPVGDAPLNQAPAPPPDLGPQPSPTVEADAPSVVESDSSPPSDVPSKVPSSAPNMDQGAPSVDEPGPGAAAPPPHRPARKRKAGRLDNPVLPPTVGGDGTPPDIQSPPTPDGNGFSIPPGLSQGPPRRTAHKPAKKKARPASSSDGPPSVDESQP